MGRTRETARIRLLEKMLKRPFRDVLAERFDSGLSAREIAPEFDMHFTEVYRLANRYGLTLPSRKKPELETADTC